MVCETLINKKLMYRLYAASRLTKICVLLLLILVKQMLDMASIESNKSSSFFLIGLSIWAIVEIVVYFVDQRREAVCILKQYDVKQFRQVVSFEKEVIRVTNVINDTNFEIPYGEIKKLRKSIFLFFRQRTNILLFLTNCKCQLRSRMNCFGSFTKKCRGCEPED